MGMSVFRQEVLDAKHSDWLGTIELAMPVSYRFLATGALAVSVCLIALLTMGHYTRHESARGTLLPEAGLLSVRAVASGVVTRVLVREGDTVAQDQPLAELTTDLDSVDIGKTRAAIAKALRALQSRADTDLQQHSQLTEQKRIGFVARLAILRDQRAQIDRQMGIQAEQAQSAHDLWEKIQPLGARGVVSGVQVEQHKAAALSAQNELAALKRQRLTNEQEIASTDDQLRQLPLIAAAEQNDIRRKRAEIDQALAQSEAQRAVVLRAAQAGTVSSLAVRPGDAIVSGARLLSLVPKDSLLEAEMWLPSRAIGLLNQGDRVAIRLDAFPYQKFGLHYGRIAEVSRSAVSPAELGALSGEKAVESLFRVRVRLDRQTIDVYGKSESLKPGMALTGDVLLERRRLIEWLFESTFALKQTLANVSRG